MKDIARRIWKYRYNAARLLLLILAIPFVLVGVVTALVGLICAVFIGGLGLSWDFLGNKKV